MPEILQISALEEERFFLPKIAKISYLNKRHKVVLITFNCKAVGLFI